jgi:protein-export membrane protein SecD
MINQKSKFSSKKRSRIIFVLIILFFLLVLVKAGDSYYNNFTHYLAEKTNNVVILPKIEENNFRLGLDLQGGSQLIYQADVSEIPDADRDDLLEGVRDVIEKRVNAFGVSEPVIQVNKTMDEDYRVIVELAGIKDIEKAKDEIGETPRLEFKEQDPSKAEISEEDIKSMEEYNESLALKAEEIYQEIEEGEDFVSLALTYNTPVPLSPEMDDLGSEDDGDLGWINKEDNPRIYDEVKDLDTGQVSEIKESDDDYAIFKLEDKKSKEDALEFKIRQISLEKITLADLEAVSDSWKNTELTGSHLSKAVLNFNPNDGSPEVSLEFNNEGAELFESITERNIGKPVAIYLDDHPISVPNVNEKISGGEAVISGNFTIDEAKELVQRLKTGALPVPINLINQKTVGASLGQNSVDTSLKAGLIGLILVALFMILFYRLLGLMSVFSLLIYGATVLAIFKALPIMIALILGLFVVALLLITFDELKILDVTMTAVFVLIGIILLVYGMNTITLTLAGIAGFILSIGMAVDANVLIFERVKEELRSGRTLRDAIDEGVRRAWPSIRDGNISTLLICLILMSFGTGVLKGFGTTLFIGVSISMFSAIVITRNFLNLFLFKKMENSKILLGTKRKKEDIIN